MRAELQDPSSPTWAAQREDIRLLHTKTGQPLVAPTIVGKSDALKGLVEVAERVAKRNAKVLITGESGVGKDVIARFIHARSPRADQRFVALNCAAFSETLLESELFGHVKGSFTGAYRDKIGKLQQAHRGTIFLDEIAEMSVRMQALLLRFLENGEIQPVGSDAPPIRSDVRVLSATNRDLTEMVAKGEFREDLLYRIKVAHIQVPPLRERKDDIRALIEHTLARCDDRVAIAEEALVLLERYRWPGNVRELQNVIEQMASMTAGDEIGIEDLPPSIAAPQGSHAYPRRERRRRVSDEVYDALISGGQRFWEDVHTMFTNRDLTRADLRQIIRRGLAMTGGNYRGVLQLFGMESQDYKKLMNFLAAHDCVVDYREFREVKHDTGVRAADAPRAADPNA
jgi:transcriptional regulator with PAS, ATPase and Fis domain